MSEEIQRDLGRHDAKIEALEQDIHLMRKDVIKIYEKLDEISVTLATASGGWKAMMMLGGISATFGALLVKFLTSLGWVPK
jgi:hypothetical protein